MPFTLSHPAAALVLRRTGLPMAAMVSGTMVPDVPLFVAHDEYGLTHSVVGIVGVDLVLGMVGLACWVLLLRDALVDSAPAFVRERLPASASYRPRQWLLAVPAVLVGAATHVGWDELTHVGRWGPEHVTWLRARHLGIAGYHWAQAISGAVGLVSVAIAAAVTLLRRPRRTRRPDVPSLANRGPSLVLAAAVIAGATAATAPSDGGLHAAAFAMAVRGVTALALGTLVLAASWQVLTRRA